MTKFTDIKFFIITSFSQLYLVLERDKQTFIILMQSATHNVQLVILARNGQNHPCKPGWTYAHNSPRYLVFIVWKLAESIESLELVIWWQYWLSLSSQQHPWHVKMDKPWVEQGRKLLDAGPKLKRLLISVESSRCTLTTGPGEGWVSDTLRNYLQCHMCRTKCNSKVIIVQCWRLTTVCGTWSRAYDQESLDKPNSLTVPASRSRSYLSLSSHANASRWRFGCQATEKVGLSHVTSATFAPRENKNIRKRWVFIEAMYCILHQLTILLNLQKPLKKLTNTERQDIQHLLVFNFISKSACQEVQL